MPDDVTTTKTYSFLDVDGVKTLSKEVLTKVNTKIDSRIVSSINNTSDGRHIPSAAAVYAAISGISSVKYKTHIGPINTVTNPNSGYIYLQRNSTSDAVWMMYIYDINNNWISIGNTDVNLTNYWSKSADDIAALRTAIGAQDASGVAATANQAKAAADAATLAVTNMQAAIDAINATYDDKVDNSQLSNIVEADLVAIVNEAFTATEVFP